MIVSMSGRAVIAAGQPFVAHDVQFADAGVARDEIATMVASAEPLVLRVSAVGGTQEERESVQGDWLCDSDGSPPSRIPKAKWRYDGDDERARAWVRGRNWFDAWERCENAAWMMSAAGTCGLDTNVVALALCACVSRVLPIIPRRDGRFARALFEAEAWRRGISSREAAHEAAQAANQAAHYDHRYASHNAPWYAAHAIAAATTYAATEHATWNTAANSAVSYAAAAEAAAAAADELPGSPSRDDVLRKMADAVRSEIPTIAVLRAVR